jgi:nanoRNase/pAp phosphatase (c-di-AMP/oligoRNAs hydrolase)/CBS domain-containing protein
LGKTINLLEAEEIMQVVTTHKNTDFDALASVIASTIIYPGAIPAIPKNINPNVKAFLAIHKDIFALHDCDEIDLKRVQRLIVVDANNWRRLDYLEKLRKKEDLDIVLWDHHVTKGNIAASWSCQEEMGANITLMIRVIKRENKSLSPMMATLFLAGIYEDTGNLTFNGCKAEDAYAAGYLLEQRADLNIVNEFLRPAYGEKQKNVLFKMLEKAERRRIGGFTVSINEVNIKGHVDSLAVVVRMYREILNVDAAFGIFTNNENDRCMVIGRSNVDRIDMGAIMRSMGGGGHPGAGSAVLNNVNPEVLEAMIVDLIEGNQRSSVQISDLMSFPVITVDSSTSMADVAAVLKEKGCTGIPVVENDKLVGIISRRDFRKIKKDSQLEAPVKAFMSPNVITIEPGKSPQQATRLMVKHDIGRLPVVEDGKIIGIITRSDSMLYFYDLLPD